MNIKNSIPGKAHSFFVGRASGIRHMFLEFGAFSETQRSAKLPVNYVDRF